MRTTPTRRGAGCGAGKTLLLGALLFYGCARREPTAEDTPPERRDPQQVNGSTESGGGEARTTWTLEKVQAALRNANPDYTGSSQFQIESGQVLAADLAGAAIADLSPLRGMGLRLLDLRQTAVSELSPLAGMPLIELYLEDTRVKHLEPLAGMPLLKLYLSNTPVEDLSALRGLPLVELNLVGTRVRDLEPLRDLPLEMLWLSETPVEDISPLARCPLVSLTLHRTQVRDLRPLSGSTLQRLHIGETPVTDLTPLSGMQLTRLIFNPSRISQGLDVARRMVSLQEIGLSFEDRMSPAEFWSRFPPDGRAE